MKNFMKKHLRKIGYMKRFFEALTFIPFIQGMLLIIASPDGGPGEGLLFVAGLIYIAVAGMLLIGVQIIAKIFEWVFKVKFKRLSFAKGFIFYIAFAIEVFAIMAVSSNGG
jgi:hypothetical protein